MSYIWNQTNMCLNELISESFILTLAEIYNDIVHSQFLPNLPATDNYVIEHYKNVIKNMNLSYNYKHVLKQLIKINVEHNGVNCNGINNKLIANIIFETFDEVYLYYLSTIETNSTIHFKIEDYEEELNGLHINYIYHMLADKLIIQDGEQIDIHRSLYVMITSDINYEDKTECEAIVEYDKNKGYEYRIKEIEID